MLYPRVNMEDEVVKEFTAKPVSVAYKSLGPALLSCCSSLLKNNIESLIHQLSSDIKASTHPSQLSVILSCVKILAQRIALEKVSTPASLPKLIGIIFYHQSSCYSCQCASLHCLTVLCYLFPGACKEYRSALSKWSKTALFSGCISLMKEGAGLLQVLNGLVKSSNEETQLFLTLIKSTHYCIAALLGEGEESEAPPPSSLIIPDLAYSQKGTDQIKILVNGVGGLSYLLRLCLLVDTCRPLDVPLDQLWGLIWRMMNNQTPVQHLSLLLLKASWQLLSVTIHSCGFSLLPYSDSLESALLKTFDKSPGPSVLPLLCKCVGQWVCLRRSCSLQFIERVTLHVCACAHRRIQTYQDCDRKVAFQFKNDDVLSIYIDTLNDCISSLSFGRLSPVTVKSVLDLCYKVKSLHYTESQSVSSLLNHPLLYLCNNDISQLQDEVLEELTQNPVITGRSSDRDTAQHFDLNIVKSNETEFSKDVKEKETEIVATDIESSSNQVKDCTARTTDTATAFKTAKRPAKKRKISHEDNDSDQEKLLNTLEDDEEDDEDIDAMLMEVFNE